MHVILYQPEIPQNTGTILRMATCFGVGVHIIEPCGFGISDRKLKRAGMDYLDFASLTYHPSWEDFQKKNTNRIVLLSTKASLPFYDFSFQEDDFIMVGRESDGVPEDVEENLPNRVLIPMEKGFRSLNVALSLGIVLGEALRQTKWMKQTWTR